jgi:hypothetical protein
VANDSENIRRLLNLMEAAASEPTLVEGWVQNIKDKIDQRMGQKERQEMAGRLNKEWMKWLGQTDREGNLEDMVRFMNARIGFTDEDIKAVLTKAAMPVSDEEINDAEEGPEKEALGDDGSDDKGYHPDMDRPVSKNGGEDSENPRDYQKDDGTWDKAKISQKLNSMPEGSLLRVGGTAFRKKDGKIQSKKAATVNTESVQVNEADDNKLSDASVKMIMDLSAAHVNDEYLLNGPRNDQDDIEAELGNRSRGRGYVGTNRGGRQSAGRYDSDEVKEVLKNLGLSTQRFNTLTQKAVRAENFSKLTDQEVEQLGMVGFAFLRSRN